jgi:hypothetical protein
MTVQRSNSKKSLHQISKKPMKWEIDLNCIYKHSIFTSQKQYTIYRDQYLILFREIIEIPSADQTPKCML